MTPSLPESTTEPRSRNEDAAYAQISWGAGIVNHGGYADLDRCLASLRTQTHPPDAIYVYDTNQDASRAQSLAQSALGLNDFEVSVGPNRGFAGGANRVIQKLLEAKPNLDYCLLLNPDVELDPSFAERLTDAIDSTPEVAIATGKLLRSDRKTLDSAGITFPRNRRPRDRGSEELDRGQFDLRENVDGASGAAMMLRVDALDDLRVQGELFDESFFAYHEDTDLCWRARNLGWKILYAPDAIAIHARGWKKGDRLEIPAATRRHSFKNHYLQILKNERAREFLTNLPWLLSWEVLRFGFVVLRDREMWPAYGSAMRNLPAAWNKRRILRSRERRRSLIGRGAGASGPLPP